MRGISWLAGDLLASQEGLCSMELVSQLVSQSYLENSFGHTVTYNKQYRGKRSFYPSNLYVTTTDYRIIIIITTLG
jgi:hypothetical protein